MPRPRLADGTLGTINAQVDAQGVWRARAKYRTLDGLQREVRGSGPSEEAAVADLRRNFEAKIPVGAGLTRQATVVETARAWLANKRATKKNIRPQSFQQYEISVSKHIPAAFGDVRFSDLTVKKAQELLNAYAARTTPATANTTRKRLVEIGKYAVRMEIADSVIFDLTDTFDVTEEEPVHFEVNEVRALRDLFGSYRQGGKGELGPRSDGQMAAICEIILGASIRPGEVLALRRMDVDATVHPLQLDINGTMVVETGVGKYRQDVPKHAKQRRRISVPEFAAAVIRSRLAATVGQPRDAFLFQTRTGAHSPPANSTTG